MSTFAPLLHFLILFLFSISYWVIFLWSVEGKFGLIWVQVCYFFFTFLFFQAYESQCSFCRETYTFRKVNLENVCYPFSVSNFVSTLCCFVQLYLHCGISPTIFSLYEIQLWRSRTYWLAQLQIISPDSFHLYNRYQHSFWLSRKLSPSLWWKSFKNLIHFLPVVYYDNMSSNVYQTYCNYCWDSFGSLPHQRTSNCYLDTSSTKTEEFEEKPTKNGCSRVDPLTTRTSFTITKSCIENILHSIIIRTRL